MTKKNFVRYISHEIRTPLNTVVMGLQLVQEKFHTCGVVGFYSGNNCSKSDIETMLNEIELSCRVAVDILNDLLLFDKIEEGLVMLQKTPVDLVDCVRQCVGMFQVQVMNYFTCNMNNNICIRLFNRILN